MQSAQTKMKVEEAIKMHPLAEAEANEAIMKADEMFKAGKKEVAAKALEETIMMYKIDVK